MVSKNQVVKAIQEGVIKAQENYNKAASFPLCWAPEYFMDVHIFQSLYKCTKDSCLILQHNNRDLLEYYSTHSRKLGRIIKELHKGSKIDLILKYSNQDKIRAFIEVKKYASVCKKDIRKICYMLENNRQFGVFGVLVSGIYIPYRPSIPANYDEAEKELNKKIKNIKIGVENFLKGEYGEKFTVSFKDSEIAKIPLEQDDDNNLWIWRPVIVVIKRNNKR